MKKVSQKILFVLSGVLFLAGALVLYWWTSGFTPWKLREQLQIVSPLFLEIVFFLLIVASVLNSSVFRKVFSDVRRGTWCMLALIVVGGLMVTMFVVPRDHRIYYDEDIYQSIGQNIAYLKNADTHAGEGYGPSFGNLWKRFVGRAAMCNEGRNDYGELRCDRLEYNKEPNGWPYLLSVVFRLFGVHELAAFVTNNLVYALAVVTTFLIGYMLFNSARIGLYSALIYALMPECMIWSNTTAVEPSAALFPGMALVCSLIAVRVREAKTLFLVAVVTAFSVQFRPESIMFLSVIGVVILLWGREKLKRGEFYLFLALFFLLLIPHLVHLFAVKEMGWGSSGPKFSFGFLKGNIKANGLFYLKNVRFPVCFTLFFILGLVLGRSREKNGGYSFFLKEKLVVFLWFLLFWGIFIFFYAGSYNYGADVRFSLLSAIPLALIAGNGTESIHNLLNRRFKVSAGAIILPLLIVFSFLPFFPFVRALTQEAWGARADHRFARKMAEAVPDDAVILSHNPNMFLLWGKNAAQASLATEHPGYFRRFFYQYRGGVYLHYNFWCNVPDKLQNSFCTNILERYDCTSLMSFKEQNYTYALYKVEKKKGSDLNY